MIGRGRGRCHRRPNTEISKPRQQVATLSCMMHMYYVMLQHAFDWLNSVHQSSVCITVMLRRAFEWLN